MVVDAETVLYRAIALLEIVSDRYTDEFAAIVSRQNTSVPLYIDGIRYKRSATFNRDCRTANTA